MKWLKKKTKEELIEIIKDQQEQITELEKIVYKETEIIPSYIGCA